MIPRYNPYNSGHRASTIIRNQGSRNNSKKDPQQSFARVEKIEDGNIYLVFDNTCKGSLKEYPLKICEGNFKPGDRVIYSFTRNNGKYSAKITPNMPAERICPSGLENRANSSS